MLEIARLQCTSVGLVAPLLDVMTSGDNDEAIQACRALGNTCFDNGLYYVLINTSHKSIFCTVFLTDNALKLLVG